MITGPQQEMIDKIAAGELTAKQKGDFYYRMSKVLQKKLDELETIYYLLDAIPLSYQDKIDIRKAAICSMKIVDKLVERLDPAFISPIIKDKDDKECDYRDHHEGSRRVGSRIIRRFKVDMKSYLPGITQGQATIKVSYEPTKEEIELIYQIEEHQYNIERIRVDSERPTRLYSSKEFLEGAKPKLESRGLNFKYEIESIVGNAVDGMPSKEDSIEQFNKIEGALGKKEEPK
jgi:hypothetical protein